MLHSVCNRSQSLEHAAYVVSNSRSRSNREHKAMLYMLKQSLYTPKTLTIHVPCRPGRGILYLWRGDEANALYAADLKPWAIGVRVVLGLLPATYCIASMKRLMPLIELWRLNQNGPFHAKPALFHAIGWGASTRLYLTLVSFRLPIQIM
ncbi:hypothetical protein FHEFKHOI_00171 [Candidatus Methanoperedenaceae archaeon GB50]|nr:hypothetical protein FHEFKHOI_00171 [Candidatus Methanoperedenaceae archaeon GB50]CAD7781415.1 MAG: hypothetical protein KBONHNOK_01634 [Candidatus Methanoperedenaceae archaeon GB50]